MFNRLYWENPNTLPLDEIRIYRHTQPFTNNAASYLIDTLTGDQTHYVDRTSIYGVKYDYRVEFMRDGLTVSTIAKEVVTSFGSGPGTNELALGDYNFGLCPLFNISGVYNPMFAQGLGYTGVTQSPTQFHKFFIDGEPVFFVRINASEFMPLKTQQELDTLTERLQTPFRLRIEGWTLEWSGGDYDTTQTAVETLFGTNAFNKNRTRGVTLGGYYNTINNAMMAYLNGDKLFAHVMGSSAPVTSPNTIASGLVWLTGRVVENV